MKSKATPVRFSTRIRRKTLKAQEIADSQLQYAKLYPPRRTSGRMSKKVSESDILDTITISLDDQPGRSCGEKQKAQDTKGIAEASGIAKTLRRQTVPSVLYAEITIEGKVEGDKNDVLPGIPGTEAPVINASADRAMQETTDYASVQPTTLYPVQSESYEQEESYYQYRQDLSVYQQLIALGIKPDPSMEFEELWEDPDGFLFLE